MVGTQVETESKKAGILDAPYRALTIGIVLIVTTMAFEGLAITTIAPKLAQHLEGIHLYGWIFSAFLLSQIIGTMIMGQQIDRRGVTRSFMAAIIIFVIGIVVAASAVNMYMLIAGRALQGFGAGASITCVYYSITLRYPDALRTKILAAFSGAYILPALIGPYLAGVIAELASWRFVFWFVLPFVVLAVLLTNPSFRHMQQTGHPPSGQRHHKEIYAIILTLGTGLLLTGLGSISEWSGIALTVAGLILLVPPLRKLLPSGSFHLRKGLPATIVSRGFYVAVYVATESYVVLALIQVKGLSADIAGLIVAAGALSWSTAVWLQSKLDERDAGKGRKKRVVIGVAMMVIGVICVMGVIGLPGGTIALAILSQICTGFGIGLANPTTGAIALQHAEPGQEGEVSSQLQFVDAFGPGLSVGIGGALIAISDSLDWGILAGIMLALAAQLLFIVISLAAACRIAVQR
ncbi:MFS transporter [Paenibacillus thiaminolyticus]|uniref:MFS transporter n=1 Tax=Paenibacillus thiaminolyticus TaxID=49283 RepID=UPI0011637765|nr:MFS transporter [Paenibacillus thiaminolyticus]NGP61834.1 MFS transporter [Paenibacillus thiaminolyticus]